MKFDLGETFEEKRERLSHWHRWFAWRPVRISDHDYRWLEYVERKAELDLHAFMFVFDYRPLRQSVETGE